MTHAPHRETVRGSMRTTVARARAEEAVSAVLARLAAERPEFVELICVCDERGRLAGVLPFARAFAHPPGIALGEVMDRDPPRAHPDDDQEHAASLALHHDLDALPVVDGAGAVVGVLPARALLHVLRREHVEDLHRLAGIQRETSRARHAIEDPPLRRARHRLPWLIAGLAGSAVATAAMAGFEATMRAQLAVAFFVPAIVYLADAVGTQSEAIAVRGLSLTRTGIGHLLAGELRTGLLIGATLGVVAFGPILAVYGDARLAGAVATSIFAASGIASAVGLLFPWLLARLRLDPAYGSGPVATIVQDILSILVYFAVLRAFAA